MIDDYAWNLSPEATDILEQMRKYIAMPGESSDPRQGLMAAVLLALTEKFGSDGTLQIVSDEVEWHFRKPLSPPSGWLRRSDTQS